MGNLHFRALLGLDDVPVRHRNMGGAEAAVPWPRHSHCLTELRLLKQHYSVKDHDDISSSLFISGKFLSIICSEGGGALAMAGGQKERSFHVPAYPNSSITLLFSCPSITVLTI